MTPYNLNWINYFQIKIHPVLLYFVIILYCFFNYECFFNLVRFVIIFWDQWSRSCALGYNYLSSSCYLFNLNLFDCLSSLCQLFFRRRTNSNFFLAFNLIFCYFFLSFSNQLKNLCKTLIQIIWDLILCQSFCEVVWAEACANRGPYTQNEHPSLDTNISCSDRRWNEDPWSSRNQCHPHLNQSSRSFAYGCFECLDFINQLPLHLLLRHPRRLPLLKLDQTIQTRQSRNQLS